MEYKVINGVKMLQQIAESKTKINILFIHSEEYEYNIGKFNDYVITYQDGIRIENISNIKRVGLLPKIFRKLIILPDNYVDILKGIINKNKKLLGSEVDDELLNNPNIIALFIYFDKFPNILKWAINNYKKSHISILECNFIYKWLMNYHLFSNRLSKKTITAYNNRHDIEQLLDECEFIIKAVKLHRIINSFNTTQRNILKNNKLSNDDITMLMLFSKLSLEKKTNIIRKVSPCNNKYDIMNCVYNCVTNKFKWNYEGLLNFLSYNDDLSIDIIFYKNNKLFIKVNNFYSMKKISSFTGWCISREKKYWDDYVQDDSYQYILFDFELNENDKNAIIGLTISDHGIILFAQNGINETISSIKVNENTNIEGQEDIINYSYPLGYLLRQKKLSFDDIITENKILLAGNFDKKTILDRLKDEIVLYNENNILTILCTQTPLNEILYRKNIFESSTQTNYIIGFDFNRSLKDPNSITIMPLDGIMKKINFYNKHNIYNAIGEEISYPLSIFINKFHIEKYIFIDDNIESKFYYAVKSYDEEYLNNILMDMSANNKKLTNHMKTAFADALCYEYRIFDIAKLINVVYNNGFTLKDMIDKDAYCNFIDAVYRNNDELVNNEIMVKLLRTILQKENGMYIIYSLLFNSFNYCNISLIKCIYEIKRANILSDLMFIYKILEGLEYHTLNGNKESRKLMNKILDDNPSLKEDQYVIEICSKK